jgi:hypothetical protein
MNQPRPAAHPAKIPFKALWSIDLSQRYFPRRVKIVFLAEVIGFSGSVAWIRNKSREQNYFCQMHPDIRQPTLGKCRKCGMDLLPEGSTFGMLRHMISSPFHLMIMAAVIIAAMMMR